MEDAAQLLGIVPGDKYRVSAEDVCQAVMDAVQAPPIAAQNLYVQFLFAWLTGNGDLHAKNVSVLQGPDGRWKISPIYDIPCTLVYGDKTLALSISGKTQGLKKTHWDEFAAWLGLNSRVVCKLNQTVVNAAAQVNLHDAGFEGSPLHGAEHELRFRRLALES